MTKVLDCPDLKKEEMAISTQKRTRGTLLPPVTLQNLVSVQLPLQLKEPEEKKHHPSYHIVNGLLLKHSFQKTVGILSRILSLSRKYEASAAQERATEIIIATYQQEESSWCDSFGGCLFYKLTPDVPGEPIYLQARQQQLGKEFLLLIPKHPLLMEKIIQHFHHSHIVHYSDEYVRTRIVRAGFYLPGALPRISKFRRACVTCKRKADARCPTKMGHIGDRLKNKTFMENSVGDFAGPFTMVNPINKRSTAKYYLLITICDFSRYIAVTIVEDLSTVAIMRAIQSLVYRYGPMKEIKSDMGSNFVGAKNRYQLLEDEVISEDTRKGVKEAARRQGITIKTRCPRAPFIQGSCEKAIGTIKKVWPERKLHFSELQFFAEFCMATVNQRPLGLSGSGNQICPLDLRPISRRCEVENNSILALNDRLRRTEEEFTDQWKNLYELSILSLKKWNKDKPSSILPGSLVQISDITGRPQLGVVESVREDGGNHPRYFKIKYTDKSGKKKYVERTGQSLCLLLSEDELKARTVRDPLDYMEEGQLLNKLKTKKKLIVKVQHHAEERIADI